MNGVHAWFKKLPRLPASSDQNIGAKATLTNVFFTMTTRNAHVHEPERTG